MPRKLVLSPMGMIVILSSLLLVMISVTLIIVSTQNLDLKNFFVTYNLSNVENRQALVESAKFREIQLDTIQQDQNRTQQLMPAFMRSINDTRVVAEFMPTLIDAVNNVSTTTEYLANNFGQSSDYLARENFQYDQANATYALMNKIIQNQQRIVGLLHNISSNQ